MPPKSGAPKSAKKKLSKAEKEKLKKEEDEKKREEEETLSSRRTSRAGSSLTVRSQRTPSAPGASRSRASSVLSEAALKEAQRRAEKEEQERKNKERAEAEETRRLENEERKRRKGQLAELDSIWQDIQEKIRTEDRERRIKAKWDRYMLCDGSPDPTILGEINTYMNLWREDPTNEIHYIMKKCKVTLDLVSELESILEDTPEEELPENAPANYRNTMQELQELVQSKIDLGSHGVLLKATELADSETMNLQQVISNDDVTLCVWGNLSKNPRIKAFEFTEKGFQFELPKILTLSDCAFRVLFTRYDHCSPQCRTYLPRIKTKEEKVEEVAKEDTEEDPNQEKKEEQGEGQEQEKVSEENKEEIKDDNPLQSDSAADMMKDVMKELEGIHEEEEEEKAKEEPAAKEEEPPQEGEPMEEDYDIKTPEPVEWEDFDGDEDVIDLRAYHIMGDVFHFNLLQLPPQPKTFKNWIITQVALPPKLEPLDYEPFIPKEEEVKEKLTADQLLGLPPELLSKLALKAEEIKERDDSPEPLKPNPTARQFVTIASFKSMTKRRSGFMSKPQELQALDYTVDASGAPMSAASKEPDEETKVRREEKPPITVNLKLPGNIYFCEEPQVVRWDHKEKQWRLDGFMDNSFDEEKKILTFKVCQFGVMALVQESHINMPFQSWEMRPRGVNHVQLTIIAAIVEIEIEIKDDKCCINAAEDKPELAHFKDKWMAPKELIKKLRNCGVNVFPAVDSHKYVSVQNKNAVTEERLYQQMALTSTCMAYSWSKWNAEIKQDDKIIIQGCEHLTDEPLQEEDWSLFMVSKKRTTKLKMVEFDEHFSEEHAEGTAFHADLYHMVTEIASEEAQQCIRQSDHRFVDAVHQMLRATLVVTYS